MAPNFKIYPPAEGFSAGHALFTYGPGRQWAYLPPQIRDLAGITSEQDSTLAHLNDGHGENEQHIEPKSFPEIADHIEANL